MLLEVPRTNRCSREWRWQKSKDKANHTNPPPWVAIGGELPKQQVSISTSPSPPRDGRESDIGIRRHLLRVRSLLHYAHHLAIGEDDLGSIGTAPRRPVVAERDP